MDPTAMTAEMKALLDHAHWVQELARKLVRDPNVAEDLAQETLLAAIRDRGKEHRSMRAWLGTVLRNLVWERVRREDRRDAREMDSAREEAMASTGDLLERMTAHRTVVEALMTLPDHYREVLLRRYFEGESPAEIAASLSIPHSTVRTRLSRATAMLRENLNAHYGGDNRAWVAALAPLVRAPLRDLPAESGIPISVPLVAAAGISIVALAAIGYLAFGSRTSPAALEQALAPELSPAVAAVLEPRSDERPDDRRVPATQPVVSDASTRAARTSLAPDLGTQGGRVIDVTGTGVVGVLVRHERYSPGGTSKGQDGDPIAISLAEGAFELPGRSGWVVAEGGGIVTVFAGTPALDGARDALVVVTAPRNALAGRIVDVSGRAVEGARVAIELPPDLRLRLGVSLDASAPVPVEATTDAEGSFALDEAPRLAGAFVVVRADGFSTWRAPAPEHPDPDLRIVLETTAFEAGMLAGRVVLPDGSPAADARVSDGVRLAVADEGGLFHLEVGEDRPERLLALYPGQRPAVATPEIGEAGEPIWPDSIVLELGPPPLAIRGRLVDAAGRGVSRVRVWVDDPTLFWRPTREREGNLTTRIGLVPLESLPEPLTVEGVLAGAEAPWSYTTTEDDGSFTLEGLADRSYVLGFLDRRTLLHFRSDPIVAGTEELVIMWEPVETHEEVRGVVQSVLGAPLGGVSVSIVQNGFRLVDGADLVHGEQLMGGRRTTGPDGRFVLRDVPVDAGILVEGPGIVTAAFGGDAVLAEPLVLTVSLFARISVALGDPDLADRVRVLGPNREALSLHEVEGPRRRRHAEVALEGGRSGVLFAPLEAATLVLLKGDQAVRELPLSLVAGELNEISVR